MPARSVCLVALSLSEAGPGRFGCQVSVIDIYHTIPSESTLHVRVPPPKEVKEKREAPRFQWPSGRPIDIRSWT